MVFPYSYPTASLVNQPCFLWGGGGGGGHTCTLAGRNLDSDNNQLTVCEECALYVQNLCNNKHAFYMLQILPTEVEIELRKGELIMNRDQLDHKLNQWPPRVF